MDEPEHPLPPKLTPDPSSGAPPPLPAASPVTPPSIWAPPAPRKPTTFEKIKKALGPFGVVLVLIGKFFAKLKFLILPIIKFLPILLKTGGSMFITIGVYTLVWGWRFAVGFVVLIFVHECGHLIAARRLGLKVGAPVFIPFMGAFIALKESPPNAWIEAQVGIGGPLFGTLGAVVCEGIYLLTDNPLFRALAYMGFFLNLFNLAPVGFLDGGRIVTALSPWLWLVGMVIVVYMLVTDIMAGHFNTILLLIVVFSIPRLLSLFRRKTDGERRYFEVTPAQRIIMAVLYFGLVAFLFIAMRLVYFVPERS